MLLRLMLTALMLTVLMLFNCLMLSVLMLTVLMLTMLRLAFHTCLCWLSRLTYAARGCAGYACLCLEADLPYPGAIDQPPCLGLWLG